MIVFRLCKSKYGKDLSGKGAELSGGRWNSKGVAMIYTSDSRALCTAEIAVHIALGILPSDYVMISIEIPDNEIREINLSKLSADWNQFPYSKNTQETGDKFIAENLSLVLKVPSVVVPGEFNYLLNPRHKNIGKVKIKKADVFKFDERLFKTKP